MTDGEFWEHVFGGEAGGSYDSWDEWAADHVLEVCDGVPCPECGAVGACGYDAEGRALIHAISEESDA